MSSIQEVFVEADWDDPAVARQQRDQRMAELQAQGLICTSENLYTVEGKRVFLLVASQPIKERLRDDRMDDDRLPTRSPSRPVRATQKYETR